MTADRTLRPTPPRVMRANVALLPRATAPTTAARAASPLATREQTSLPIPLPSRAMLVLVAAPTAAPKAATPAREANLPATRKEASLPTRLETERMEQRTIGRQGQGKEMTQSGFRVSYFRFAGP